MKYWFAIIFFLIQGFELQASCSNPQEMQAKLQHLRLEVACSGQSLHECQNYLANDQQVEEEGEECSEIVAPVSVLPAALKNVMHELEQYRLRNGQVKSLEEFYEHTRLHRARVKDLGMELFKSHPELFEGLTATQVQNVLEAHDLAKVNASSGLNGKPFYRILYENYGNKIDRKIIDELNAADKRYMQKALRVNGIDSPELTDKMARIEKIADAVDRGMSPVSTEEFGRSMSRASQFYNDPEDVRLALELESKYHQVIAKHAYKGLLFGGKRRIAKHLAIEEAFLDIMRSQNSMGVSARVMAHSFIESMRNTFSRFLELLLSKTASKAFLAFDGAFLFFANMDNIACAERGHHDWIKAPNCKPAVGLTPRVVEFLNMGWATQQEALTFEPSTCDVIQKTYQQSLVAPKVLKCSGNEVDLKMTNSDNLSLKLDENNRIQNIKMLGFKDLTKIPFVGSVEEVTVGEDGLVKTVCFKNKIRGSTIKRCFNGDHENARSVSELLRSLNYQIQKGISCCLRNNSDSPVLCQ